MEKYILTAGVDSFTLLDLFRKAALHKGLKLYEGASKAYSDSIKEYVLDDKLLSTLAKQEIKRQARPDHNGIFTLVDENSQEEIPGWEPSNYWNFKPFDNNNQKFDLRVSLNVGFTISIKKRGVVFCPLTHNPFVSANDRLPNFRMFKALVESDEDAPAVAKELAASDGNIIVNWTDLGLGGIRNLINLFDEFVGQNETVKELAKKQEVFNPALYPQYQQPGDELFITEPAQPKVFQMWQDQLKQYRNSLVI